MADRHEVSRVRYDLKMRHGTVASLSRPTPRMRRIVFKSDDFADFDSASPDDHVKIFFEPGPDGVPINRDYTPRAFDVERKLLTIDFALHGDGPATRWASMAKIGDTLAIGGPKGSTVVPDDFDWYLLMGDETAIPAIGRRIEELRSSVLITAIVIVDDDSERQSWAAHSNVTQRWLIRDSRSDDELFIAALADYEWPNGDGYVWFAAEGSVARTVRAHILENYHHPAAWLKAAGYWVRGGAGVHEVIRD